MEKQTENSAGKDEKLWAIAKKRVGFKKSLVVYIVINIFLWLLWLFTKDDYYNKGIPWPIWSTLGWGIAIVFQYFEAYKFSKENATEKEYEKMKRNQN